LIAVVLLLAGSASTAAPVRQSITAARDGSRTMTLSVVIDAPRRELWDALTSAEGWKRWATRVAWQVQAKPRIIETSYDAAAKPGGPTTIRQQFVTELPYRRLSFQTIKAPEGFKHFGTYKKVVNQVELIPLGPNRTRIIFSAGPYPDTPAGRELFGFFSAGNKQTLENMANVLGHGAHSRFADH
jgi:uncharacterized protein YndB with AHSA1/START domain